MNEASQMVNDHGFAVALGIGTSLLTGWIMVMIFKRVLFDDNSLARTWLNHHVLFIERTGDAMNSVTESSREISRTLQDHTALMERNNHALARLTDLHEDPDSKFSTVRTNEIVHRVEDKVDWIKERMSA